MEAAAHGTEDAEQTAAEQNQAARLGYGRESDGKTAQRLSEIGVVEDGVVAGRGAGIEEEIYLIAGGAYAKAETSTIEERLAGGDVNQVVEGEVSGVGVVALVVWIVCRARQKAGDRSPVECAGDARHVERVRESWIGDGDDCAAAGDSGAGGLKCEGVRMGGERYKSCQGNSGDGAQAESHKYPRYGKNDEPCGRVTRKSNLKVTFLGNLIAAAGCPLKMG